MLETQQTWSCNMLHYCCFLIFKYSISEMMYAVLVQHFPILIAHFCSLSFSFGVRVFVSVFSSTNDFAPRQELVWKDPLFYATRSETTLIVGTKIQWNERTVEPIQWIHVSFVKSRSNRCPSNVLVKRSFLGPFLKRHDETFHRIWSLDFKLQRGWF